MTKQKTYIAIDLKSFYASVECKERNRDPLTTNLVVADKSRTEKTICLAVSTSLKSYGIPGRPRLFEVVQKVKEVNNTRRWKAPNHTFVGSSDDSTELNANPALEIDYIVAPPRMAYYLEYSTKIYSVYLKYIAPEDIFPYSIDEVFIDATNYLNTYQMTARELAMTMIQDVLKTTGITATAGIGTNMYLCKIAMDIVAKHIEPDKDGVRIAELDEMSYRRQLWNHRPLTDFWRVGKGYAKKLEEHGLFTMGDIARCSIGKSNELYNEELLYKLFGINEEARDWYEKEAAEQTWSVRTLQRNISSQYYYRMLGTQKKELVESEMKELTASYQNDKLEFIKNPVVAEFLGFSQNTDFTESDLEKSILSNLQKFLMELGKGYAFVARQQHIHTEKQDYYIDLVFYNYILKCFVLIDLKTEKITHQDVGQMDMYIRMYDELKRSEGDNPTIGIVLCSDTDDDIARYSVMHGNEQLFASKYKLYLPTKEELKAEIETQKAMFYLQQQESEDNETE